MTSTQSWPVGQPLCGAIPQPGTHKPPGPLHTSPESAAPHALSSPAQPQMPRSGRHTGFTPPHSAPLAAVHSVQAPRSGPARWHAGRSGSGQLGAPSVVHATHVRVVVEHTGVTPLQWVSFRQAAQTPTPDETSQRGADAGQWLTSVAVQAAHAPEPRQSGVAAPHSALLAQARHVRTVPSHTGVAPPHWAPLRQPTQAPAPSSHTGVAPLQRLAFVTEHCPQRPLGWHAGSAPPQSSSALQARHVCEFGSHTGVAPPHELLSRHRTQTPAAA